MQLDKYDQALFYEIFNKREYWILDDIIKQSNTILDIWWHIWLFSLYSLSLKFWVNPAIDNWGLIIDFTKTLDKDFQIYYFEPVKNYFNKAEIILKDFKENVIFNNFGFSDVAWVEKMYSSNISSQTSLFDSFLTWWGKIIENCEFHSLNELIFENKFSEIDIMKIDVEWKEFDILLWLDENYFKIIKNIFIEYHILDSEFENKYLQLVDKLKKNYSRVDIIESQYSSKIWYIFCTNQ